MKHNSLTAAVGFAALLSLTMASGRNLLPFGAQTAAAAPTTTPEDTAKPEAAKEATPSLPRVAVMACYTSEKLMGEIARSKSINVTDQLSSQCTQAILRQAYTEVVPAEEFHRELTKIAATKPMTSMEKNWRKWKANLKFLGEDKARKVLGDYEPLLLMMRLDVEDQRAVAKALNIRYILLPVMQKSVRLINKWDIIAKKKKNVVAIKAYVLDMMDSTIDAKQFDAAKLAEGKENDIKGLLYFEGNGEWPREKSVMEVAGFAADDMATKFVRFATKNAGIVIADGKTAMLNIGERQGVKIGDAFDIYRVKERKANTSGLVLNEEIKIGSGEVTQFVVTKNKKDKNEARALLTTKIDTDETGKPRKDEKGKDYRVEEDDYVVPKSAATTAAK